MYELSTLIAVAIICLLIGSATGYFMLSRIRPEQQSRAALEKQFAEIQKQQQDYQQEVSGHFDRTAELLNDLAESYRNVHNHIASGARDLHSTGISPLQTIPEGRPVLEGNPAVGKPSQQPLDYAPRQPGSKGALHEEFGLDKDADADHDPKPPVAPHA